MAHTPGPWRAAVDLPNWEKCDTDGVYSCSSKLPVCKMTGDVAHGYDDARLIAAAPDLLAALKQCRLSVLPSSWVVQQYPPAICPVIVES